MNDFFKNTKIIIKYRILDVIKYINILNGLKFYLIDIKVWKRYFLFFKNISNNFLLINKSELNKNFFFIFKILSYLNNNLFLKNTYLVAVGGGVTGDIAGLVSSIYLRGINLIHVPTTIVSQVDSSIGGKNGVNMINGKNIIGTIYQPLYIIIAIEFLYSLSYCDFNFGFSEIIKIMIINCPFLYFLLFRKQYILLNKLFLYKLIKYGICGKIIILRRDIYDVNYRLKLNLGHTFGHAIESYSNYLIPHNISVFVGIYIASIFSYCYCGLNFKNFIKIYCLLYIWNFNILGILFSNVLGICDYFFYDKKRNLNKVKIIVIKKIGKVLIKNYYLSFIIKFCNKIYLINELIKRL